MRDGCWPCFALGLGTWLLATVVCLAIIGRFSVETYFVVSFVGLLALMQLYAPTEQRPRWWRNLRRVEAVCMLVFAYLIAVRVVAFI